MENNSVKCKYTFDFLLSRVDDPRFVDDKRKDNAFCRNCKKSINEHESEQESLIMKLLLF
jgi:hypothetical protein